MDRIHRIGNEAKRTLAVFVSSILFILSIPVDYLYRFPDALEEAQARHLTPTSSVIKDASLL